MAPRASAPTSSTSTGCRTRCFGTWFILPVTDAGPYRPSQISICWPVLHPRNSVRLLWGPTALGVRAWFARGIGAGGLTRARGWEDDFRAGTSRNKMTRVGHAVTRDRRWVENRLCERG